MREVQPDLYKRASEGRLRTRDAMKFLRTSEWGVMGPDEVAEMWRKVTPETLLEDVKESIKLLRTRDGGERPVSMSEVVRRVCEDIDLFAQSR